MTLQGKEILFRMDSVRGTGSNQTATKGGVGQGAGPDDPKPPVPTPSTGKGNASRALLRRASPPIRSGMARSTTSCD